MEIDHAAGLVQKINEVLLPEHLPVGVVNKKGIVNRGTFNDWWADRGIPASRSDISAALKQLDITSVAQLPMRCYGLSLSDQYWLCPEHSNLTWEKINFFDNDFSHDIW